MNAPKLAIITADTEPKSIQKIISDPLRSNYALNSKNTLYLSYMTDRPQEKYLLKCYEYDNSATLSQQQKRLQSLFSRSIHSELIPKPRFSHKTNKPDKLFIAQQIQTISLQTIISLHKLHKRTIDMNIIVSFCKIYDTLIRLKNYGLFHHNIKPSNIFMKISYKKYSNGDNNNNNQNRNDNNNYINNKQIIEQIQWVITQTSLLSKNNNKFYSKPNQQFGSKTNISTNNMNTLMNDFYSVGIILIQMITLDSIQKIYESVLNDKLQKQYFGQQQFSNSQVFKRQNASQRKMESQSNISVKRITNEILLRFIKMMINFNVKYIYPNQYQQQRYTYALLYQQLLSFTTQFQSYKFSITYQNFYFTAQKLQKFIKSDLINNTLKKYKRNYSIKKITFNIIVKKYQIMSYKILKDQKLMNSSISV